jgi:predicted methyltransferase
MILRPLLAASLTVAVLAGPAAHAHGAKPHAAKATADVRGAVVDRPGVPTPSHFTAAVADPARPAADRANDATRLPAQLLAFAQVSRGHTVGDFVMGGGYVTRLLSAAVGPEGHVYAFQPAEFVAKFPKYGEDQKILDAAYPNVDAVAGPFAAPAFPVPLDTIITIQNFHDLYLKPFPANTAARASAALFAALKPGGTLVVVDHSARAGSGATLADSLHRIEKPTVVAALAAAGFTLEAESPMYAHPTDPHTANVFDESIRGRTDQFALRFRKPR